MSALVIAYARPFTDSRDWPKFPLQLMEFESDEKALHGHMIQLRNTLYAHSDSKNYFVKPWRSGGFYADIVAAPALRMSAEEAALLKQMIGKLQLAIRRRMRQIVPVKD
jgi:hypothetical protein